MKRPGWDEYFLGIAEKVALRATCIRRQYGAIIVKDNEIISTGYCGAATGVPNCCDGDEGCERDRRGCKPGEGYEHCVSVHAEENAIIKADREKMKGATLYVTGVDAKTKERVSGKPCNLCERRILNAGISEVIISSETKGKSASWSVLHPQIDFIK